ncbi:MAG TPA: acyclic terpene utilization AtuA family protein, partial [Acidimicrobiales bacterium]|nr:acyclic terpene utilization AtuA family protein [Acidimicrobiales bacterium]
MTLRIANCSGFFGDRAGAAREMVEGGPIDVLTGDWLAELTMYILHKTRERSGGYARTFLRELEDVLPTCVERGITVVANAGGLDPERLAAEVRALGGRQGVTVRVASVAGDDITPRLAGLRAAGERFVNLDTGEELPAGADVVTANAYLRARPIADALAAGAQVVVTGRVTDAALVVGPALHAFGWAV